MRNAVLFTTAALLLAGSYFGLNPSTSALAQVQSGKVVPLPPAPPDDPAAPKKTDPAAKAPVAPRSDKQDKSSTEGSEAARPEKAARESRALTPAEQADEKAIRDLAESLSKAYQEGNAKAAAAHFTTDAEFVDEAGDVAKGRDEIEDRLSAFFGEHPSCKLEFNIDTIRFIAPGLAVEDGSTHIIHTEEGGPTTCRYTAVHVKQDGKWLTASVRDQKPKHSTRQHASELKQLDWLLGDWVDEGQDSLILFSCEAVDGGNYLERKFTVHVHGQPTIAGTQRIGWDPNTGRFRVWLFDSEGGYADGTLRRDGERWVLRMAGVTADGENASGTSIYTLVNDHTMTWQNVDHEIAGEQVPDSEVISIVRQAPSPDAGEKLATPKVTEALPK